MIQKAVGDKQLHPRFKNEEMRLIKDTFCGNDELIKLCYKVFYQITMTAEEQKIISDTFKGDDLKGLLQKLFCPGIQNEQIFFGIDDWNDLPIAEKTVDEAYLFIKSREISTKYTKERLEVLFGGEIENPMELGDITEIGEDKEAVLLKLLARKEIISKVRNIFGFIQAWAGQKSETIEETAKRLYKDSAK